MFLKLLNIIDIMKFKVFFISIFLLHSSFSFAVSNEEEWKWVTKTDSASMYFNKKNLVKRNGNLFIWTITNQNEKGRFGKSWKDLNVTDCKQPYSFKILSQSHYNGEMGTGEVNIVIPKDYLDGIGFQYPPPNSMIGNVIKFVCDYADM